MDEFKVGERVTCDLDGMDYNIVQIGSRNDLEPLEGVKLVGDCIVLENDYGKRIVVYAWEVTKLKEA